MNNAALMVAGPVGKEAGKSLPVTVYVKLYKMLEEENAMFKDRSKRGAVGWGKGGVSFVVWDMNDFTTKVLWVSRIA